MAEGTQGVAKILGDLLGQNFANLAQPGLAAIPIGLGTLLSQQLQALPSIIAQEMVSAVNKELESHLQDVKNVTQDVQDVFLKLQKIMADLSEFKTDMATDTSKNHQETINKLKAAVDEWRNVAVFVRGNFEDKLQRITDVELKDAVTPANKAFGLVESTAKSGIKILGNYKAKITDTYYADLVTLGTKIETVQTALERSLESTANAILTTESSLSEINKSIEQEKESIESTRRRAESIDDDLSWDFAHVFHDTSSMYDGIRQAQINLTKTQLKCEALKKSREQLNEQQKTQQNSLTALAKYKEKLEEIKLEASALLKKFQPLQDSMVEVVRQVGVMASKAEITTKLSWTKEKYAIGILEVCILSDVHPEIPIRVSLIQTELKFGYGLWLPSAVSKVADRLDQTSNHVLLHYEHW